MNLYATVLALIVITLLAVSLGSLRNVRTKAITLSLVALCPRSC